MSLIGWCLHYITIFDAVDVGVETVDGAHAVFEVAVAHVRVDGGLWLCHGRRQEEGVHRPLEVLFDTTVVYSIQYSMCCRQVKVTHEAHETERIERERMDRIQYYY